MIEPKVLKGFRDFLPESCALREKMESALKEVFRLYGFVPIDTPCLEYSEVLLRKSNGETEKQVFRFNDNGGRDVCLRFDLTVPFARFIAMHFDELYFPFKRYHISKVWRGEKPQSGRYREFTQCDFDTIGCDSAASDAEVLLLMGHSLAALTSMIASNGHHKPNSPKITIHINHRGLLSRFLAKIGEKDKEEDILRIIDKVLKAGMDCVRQELISLVGDEAARSIAQYISAKGTWDEVLEQITALAGGEGDDTRRLKEVHEILTSVCQSTNEQTVSYILDPSITRGLDYYTGVVAESFFDDLPAIGSVCSGGRYDNLAGLYMKEKLPGVGASVGLDRLIAALDTLYPDINRCDSALDVEVFADDKSTACEREAAASAFRRAGLKAEAALCVQKMGKQYALAEKKGAKWGAFVLDKGITLKLLATRQTSDYGTIDEAVRAVLEAM